MGKDAAQATIVIIVVVIIVAVAIGSVRPTMVETGPALTNSGDQTPTSIPVGPDGARVRGGSQSSGISLLGLRFGGSTSLKIEFPIAQECSAVIGPGDQWPGGGDGCDSGVPVAGEVLRQFDDPFRGSLLVVEMPVSAECFVVATGGGVWPTGLPECSSEETR